MQDLLTLLREAGLNHITPEFTEDFIRAGESEYDKPEWFIGYEKNGLKWASFGNFRLDTRGFWKSTGESFTEDEALEMDRIKQESKAKELVRQEEISLAGEKEWGVLMTPPELHPYLVSKGLDNWCGAKQDAWGNLVIPLRDATGKIWSLQRITPSGEKKFWGRMKGCFYEIKETNGDQSRCFIAEGFATGASVHAATGHRVLVAFNAGNLGAVAKSLRDKNPTVQIVIAGDNDANGTGQKAAQEAARAIGGTWVMPDTEGQDFNDLMVEKGLDAVREKLLQNNSIKKDAASAVETKKTKKKSISEKTLSDWMLQKYGEDIVRQDDSLFEYDGKCWRELKPIDEDGIKNQINTLCGDTLESKHCNSVFKTFKRYVPSVPEGVNLFEPNPFATNFENGTLHLVRDAGHKYKLEFRGHRRGDYLINCLPYKYAPGSGAKNQEFLDMLDRVFEGDPDKADKILAVQEMYGACLVPAFPRLFMLYGKPSTGKSTILKMVTRLIGKANMSFIPPSDFHGFLMQPMAGKLVNMDSDVPTDKPISDAIVKKIIERAPMNIQRKGLENVWAHIPAVHLFGGNKIPETKDISGAHTRRWTFLEFNQVVDSGGKDFKGEYWDYCYEQSPEGVLNFAIGGLERLCANGGMFTVPGSGKEAMIRWSSANDRVGKFLDDIANGDVPDFEVVEGIKTTNQNVILLDKEGKLLRSKLWDIYKEWAHHSFGRNILLDKHKVFQLLRERGFVDKEVFGGWYWFGIKVGPKPKAQM